MQSIFVVLCRIYLRLFRRQEDAQLREIVEVLREVPALTLLSRSTLRDLAEAVHPRIYKRDEYIYYENDPGLGLYIVRHGRVRLLTEDENNTPQELRQLGENGLFGEFSILGTGEIRRMESAQALTETHVLGFFSPDLKTMLKRNPKSAASVLVALARHLSLRQAEIVRRLTEHQGKVKAMHLLEGPPSRPNVLDPDVPVIS